LTPAWTAAPTKAPYYINSVALSGAGDRALAGTFYHTYGSTGGTASSETGIFGTYCYDRSGNLVWKDEFKGWQGVYWVDVSTDGEWAAAGGWFSQSPMHGFVRAYAGGNGQKALDYPTNARVNQVALSADGSWLVSAADTLVLFQRTGSNFVKSDEYTSPTASDTMETIALSADGATLIAGDYAGTIMVFSLQNGKFGTPVIWKLPGGGYSHCVRVNPTGSAFAAGGSSGNFYLFDTAAFRANPGPTVTYNVPNAGSVYGVALTDDASAFAGIVNVTGGTGQVYYVGRQGGTGTLQWTFPTQHNPNSIWINSAAKLVAVADGHPDGTPGAFYLLNGAAGALLGQYGTGNMSWPLVISRNGSGMFGGSDDSHAYFFDLTSAHAP
jgi:WD40 repeat protein